MLKTEQQRWGSCMLSLLSSQFRSVANRPAKCDAEELGWAWAQAEGGPSHGHLLPLGHSSFFVTLCPPRAVQQEDPAGADKTTPASCI